MSIPRETIDLIRDRSRIEEIVKRYVPSLTKRGSNYVGLCPFHKERTPSFTVSPQKQIFYCFGCQTGGNVFSFISKIENLNFPESVRFLGKLVGIEVREQQTSAREKGIALLKKINNIAMNIYKQALFSEVGRSALEYARERGMDDKVIMEFSIGYAPADGNYLVSKLMAEGVLLTDAVKLGLIAPSAKGNVGSYYDRFRHRLMFPIFDISGDVVAFGGRILGDGEPKYLNSPESDLFKKGAMLYAFNLAKDSIADLKRAIIVEGYLDVIGFFQNGIRNVVAPLGTSLTAQQLDLLSRYCTEIVLLFDADDAGIKASRRALNIAAEKNVEVKVAQLPEGDPFDYVKRYGIRRLMSVVDTAIPPIEYRIQHVIAESGKFSKGKLLLSLFRIIDEIHFDSEKREYLKKIGHMLDIDEKIIISDYERYREGRKKTSEKVETKKSGEEIDYLKKCHRELVLLLLSHPELIESAMMDFSAEAMTDTTARAVFSKIAQLYSEGRQISLDRIFDEFPNGEIHDFLERGLEKSFAVERPNEAYSEIYINIKLHLIRGKIASLLNEAKKYGNNVPTELLVEIESLKRDEEKLVTYLKTR
ncbi:MAG: DNA primase [Spirochaetes bacterium]|nr:DNA primase [Spirochaetota bacterium]